MISSVDVIVPTWNSMPEFKDTLESIKCNIPRDFVHSIIIVDRESHDGTLETAESFGEYFPIRILTDTRSLGSARMKGLQKAKTKWIWFADSDIDYIKSWYPSMMEWYDKLSEDNNLGWIFGKTIDDREKIKKLHLWEAKRKFRNGAVKLEREQVLNFKTKALTNNSFCLRKPLLEAAGIIYDVSGYEDGVLTKTMLDKGYSIFAVPALCSHLRVQAYGKWGEFTHAWGIYGIKKAGGHPKAREHLYLFNTGVYCSFVLRDPFYFFYFAKRFFSIANAIWFDIKEKDRG